MLSRMRKSVKKRRRGGSIEKDWSVLERGDRSMSENGHRQQKKVAGLV